MINCYSVSFWYIHASSPPLFLFLSFFSVYHSAVFLFFPLLYFSVKDTGNIGRVINSEEIRDKTTCSLTMSVSVARGTDKILSASLMVQRSGAKSHSYGKLMCSNMVCIIIGVIAQDEIDSENIKPVHQTYRTYSSADRYELVCVSNVQLCMFLMLHNDCTDANFRLRSFIFTTVTNCCCRSL